jgi:RNA polymerase sigma-70 factor, ECF subfamily
VSDVETDRSLWARALGGDGAAYAVVYDRYAPRLLAYAFRRTGSPQRAEDAVSLVMLETWRRRREVRFGDDDSLAGWLFRTARYVLANDSRAARRHREALSRIARLAPPAPDDVVGRLVDGEQLRRVVTGLSRLSERDRDVLELATWSGLSEAGMAEALGIPVGTFKSRLARARRRLAERTDIQHQRFAVAHWATTTEVQP